MSRWSFRISLASVTICLFLGCGPKDLSEVELPIPTESEPLHEKPNRTQTVAVTNADVTSPATDISQPNSDTPPEEICRRFLRELNRENPDQFKLLLTSAAINVSSQLKFDLPPVADANSKFELDSPRFASIRRNVCFVDCRLADSTVNTKESSIEPSKITWMLRKTKSGWRVAGMLVPGEEFENLLSFESRSDLVQIRESLTEEVSTTVQAD